DARGGCPESQGGLGREKKTSVGLGPDRRTRGLPGALRRARARIMPKALASAPWPPLQSPGRPVPALDAMPARRRWHVVWLAARRRWHVVWPHQLPPPKTHPFSRNEVRVRAGGYVVWLAARRRWHVVWPHKLPPPKTHPFSRNEVRVRAGTPRATDGTSCGTPRATDG